MKLQPNVLTSLQSSFLHADKPWQTLFFFVGLALVAYIPSLRCSFIWDDNDYVTDNVVLRTLEGLWQLWTDRSATPQYYPIVHTSFWIEYHLWGIAPLGYHLVNILLHGMNGWLVYRLGATLNLTAAWLAAVLFVIHPVHVESVTWITERKNVLSALFYLASGLVYLNLVTRSNAAVWRTRFSYACSLLLFVAALLSKSVTASLPAALLLILVWKQPGQIRHHALRLAPFFLVGILAGLNTAWIEYYQVGANVMDIDWSVGERLQIAGRVPWFYVSKLVWPVPLMFMYPRWQIDVSATTLWMGLAGCIALIGLLALVRHRLGSGPLVAALFFGGTLFPVLGFTNVYPMRFSIVADHFQYLASLGPLTLGAWLLNLGGNHRRLGVVGQFVTGGIILGLVGVGWSHQQDFLDEDVLWARTFAKNPDCYLAVVKRGIRLQRQGNLNEAEATFRAAIELAPNFERSWHGLGEVLHERGRVEEAIEAFQTALVKTPDYYPSALALSHLYEDLGDLAPAIELGRVAVRYDRSADSAANLARLLIASGQLREANRELRRALEIAPNHIEALTNYATLCGLRGDMRQSEQYFRRVLAIDVLNPGATRGLALIYWQQRNYRQALDWALRTLGQQPEDVGMLVIAAWIYAAAPDASVRAPLESLRIAKRLEELAQTPELELLDLQAAAHAANGEFQRATIVLQQGMELASSNHPAHAMLKAKHELYQSKKLAFLPEN